MPRACGPSRAKTTGKDEGGLTYVEHNAMAGRKFRSWAKLEADLVC